jgi:hypothetical protein
MTTKETKERKASDEPSTSLVEQSAAPPTTVTVTNTATGDTREVVAPSQPPPMVGTLVSEPNREPAPIHASDGEAIEYGLETGEDKTFVESSPAPEVTAITDPEGEHVGEHKAVTAAKKSD